jgi:hypothetical protein
MFCLVIFLYLFGLTITVIEVLLIQIFTNEETEVASLLPLRKCTLIEC